MAKISTMPNGINPRRHGLSDVQSYELAEEAFLQSSIPLIDKIEAFPRFATKRSMARFMAKEKIFEKILPINGAIIECGVFNGAGLFTWAQLSNIHEPVNYNRRIIGFDTFQGFVGVNEIDVNGDSPNKVGDLCGSTLEEIDISLKKYNSERHIKHILNLELIRGDFERTGEEFMRNNSHILISLLYLDFDLYEPTRKALEVFLPRMPKGAIVAFDELNCSSFPGETRAFDEVMGIRNHRIERFPFDPWISYSVLS